MSALGSPPETEWGGLSLLRGLVLTAPGAGGLKQAGILYSVWTRPRSGRSRLSSCGGWLLADAERTINKDGVHFQNEIFIAPQLNELVGERVGVR
jgi:hypothetical protein